ncbi:MAG: OmpH family outer membrane protein [Flavobacteriales bacterium]
MKNLSLGINAVLAIAIAVLFYFQFAEKAPEARKNTVDSAVVDSVSATLKIAYINQDSLLLNYRLIDELETDLEVERKKSERRVKTRTATLEKEVETMAMEFQRKYEELERQGSTMNETLRNMKMQELQSMQTSAQEFSMAAEQDVMALQEKEQRRLLNQEAEGTLEVNKRMKEFIKDYNAEYGFSFVLAYSNQAGGILYGNPALDITKDVVDGLNAIYDEEKAAEAAEAEKSK